MGQGANNNDYFVLQAENNHWCNERLLSACQQLSTAEYFASRAAFFSSIHETLVHIAHVDRLYLDRLKQLPQQKLPKLSTLEALIQYQAVLDQELIDYVMSLSDTDLKQSVSFVLADGTAVNELRYRVLIHLSNHQIHHRGQVHNMLSQTNVIPPQLDEFYF